jgi:hypothetical protein
VEVAFDPPAFVVDRLHHLGAARGELRDAPLEQVPWARPQEPPDERAVAGRAPGRELAREVQDGQGDGDGREEGRRRDPLLREEHDRPER